VKEVRIQDDGETALVIVPDYQLSLAIGKEGQNARLAARLTGWRIDIKSETQFADEQRGARAVRTETAERRRTESAEPAPAAATGDGGATEEAVPPEQPAPATEPQPTEAG
jgi:N utilization substance protein A